MQFMCMFLSFLYALKAVFFSFLDKKKVSEKDGSHVEFVYTTRQRPLSSANVRFIIKRIDTKNAEMLKFIIHFF